jgi:hypothetical protein
MIAVVEDVMAWTGRVLTWPVRALRSTLGTRVEQGN